MNIFLTGVTGGLGCRLMGLLQKQGHILTALTRREIPSHEAGIRFIPGDLLNPTAYAREVGHAEAIIHLAAVTHSPHPGTYDRVNAEGTRLLLETASASGFKGRFLFVSTRAVGDACGAYGASKSRAEELVRKSKTEWTIIRPAEVYGASGTEAISSLISMARSSRIIPVPGWGRDKLAPVHVDDVLGGIIQALGCVQAARKTYVLAGPEEMTYSELVGRLLRLNNRKAITLPIPYPFLRALAWGCARLGWRKPPIVADQIDRLRCFKSADILAAVRELAYCPRDIEAGVRACLADAPINRLVP